MRIRGKTGLFIIASIFFFSFFNELVLVSLENTDSTSLQFYHLMSIMAIPFLIKNRRLRLPNTVIIILFGFICLIAIINFSDWGIGGLLFNYIFGFYILIVILTLGKNYDCEDWNKMFRIVGGLLLALIIIKLFIYRDALIVFIKRPYGHPSIPSFVGGGVNLESVCIALFSIVFLNKGKIGYLYWSLCLFVSALYASRVGVIACICCIFLHWYRKKAYKNIVRLFAILIFLIIFLLILSQIPASAYVMHRFFETGKDAGSEARFILWRYALKIFFENPFGIGCGNAIKAVRNYAYVNESNLHNIYMQMLIDQGIVGIVIYISIIIIFLIKELKVGFSNPYAGMLAVYLIIGLFQYRGAEVIMFVILGVYLCINKEDKLNDECAIRGE